MKKLASLFREIDRTTKTNAKVKALVSYFKEADDRSKLWTIALFTHRRPKRTISTAKMREWAAEKSALPLWLFEESYHIVGDLAETIALLLPTPVQSSDKHLYHYIEEMMGLKNAEEETKKEWIYKSWEELNTDERFLFNKLITGGFRIGVSQKLITRALSQALDIEEATIAHRLMGNWSPVEDDFQKLLTEENEGDHLSRPYPFYLAYALDNEVEEIGTPSDWLAEWKWDGIRGQIIKRSGELYVWSRGEELVTDKFPEFRVFKDIKEDNWVIDGEIICFKENQPMPFNILQTRIGRKNVAKKHLIDAPVVIIAYDLLEWNGVDLRNQAITERRKILRSFVESISLKQCILSPELDFETWGELSEIRAQSRAHYAEGLMLKWKEGNYKVGRKKGEWWKWKVDPMTIDAVMIYAQRGHGRRANLYTDFTFAVWDGDKLVPFAKAYSGLTDQEFEEISRWVRKNTIERFGPVCSVHPVHVFELAFEGIAYSRRHKSGVALRFPRMKRWRKDKPAAEADTLENLKKHIN